MILEIGRILITVFSGNCLNIKNPLQSSCAAQVLGGTQENENYLTRLAGQVLQFTHKEIPSEIHLVTPSLFSICSMNWTKKIVTSWFF